jgi:hypothetical protein
VAGSGHVPALLVFFITDRIRDGRELGPKERDSKKKSRFKNIPQTLENGEEKKSIKKYVQKVSANKFQLVFSLVTKSTKLPKTFLFP